MIPILSHSFVRSMLRGAGLRQHGVALIVVGFFAFFAPLVCIIHCHMLVHQAQTMQHQDAHVNHSTGSTLSQPLTAASFVVPPATTALLCDLALTVPADTPALPSETTLPPVLHDLLPAVLVLLATALLLEVLPMRARTYPQLRIGAPPIPPPKATRHFA